MLSREEKHDQLAGHLMREAIRTQMHSDALRRTQMHSDALRRTQAHSDALRRTQAHSRAGQHGDQMITPLHR